jgi:formimidoylglutamate deiminase
MKFLFAERALLPGGWARDVRVGMREDGRIAAVETGAEARPGDELLAGRILLPAPANLHSHAFQRAMAGMTEARGPDTKGGERDSFWTWRKLMYRFLGALTPEDVEAIAALVQVEMAEAGYAASAEFHYLHHEPGGGAYDDVAEMATRIAAAADQTGIGLTLLPVLYMQGGCDGRKLAGGQLRFASRDFDEFTRLVEGAAAAVGSLSADAGMGVAPHSLRAVPLEMVREAARLRPDDPVHIHAAEQTAEVQGLARSGAVAGLCPITESNLGDGIFDGPGFREAGGMFGIGSDSNVDISLAGELRTFVCFLWVDPF